MRQMIEPHWTRKLLQIAGWLAAWTWAIVAGIGGLGLIITEGPLPGGRVSRRRFSLSLPVGSP